MPTAAEQAGDFSQDFSGAAAPNTLATDQCGASQPAAWVGGVYTSTIPAAFQTAGNPFKLNAVDPAGSLLGQFYPAPNTPLANGINWFDSERVTPQWSEINGRGDYDLTQKHRVTFRWTQDTWKAPGPDRLLLGRYHLPHGEFRLEPAFQKRHGQTDLTIRQQHGE